MKTLLTVAILSTLSTTVVFADAIGPQPAPLPTPAPSPGPVEPIVQIDIDTQPPTLRSESPAATVAEAPSTRLPPQDEGGWKAPVGRRMMHGFRIGWNYIYNYDKPSATRDGMTIKDEIGLKTPHSMLLGYEGFYRIVGHSWLNVLLVGNVTVAGLEQSKFIPAASGLIGFEFAESFQLGIGVNLTPDTHSPSHMIAAAGWTPRVGGIHTPVHFYFVPDTEGNHRTGATVGVTW